MLRLKEGERVKVLDREAKPQDNKTGMFYNFYRGLTGSVRKVYSTEEIAIEVDLDELPEDIWRRHMQVRDQMREKWIGSLPDDVKRKLTPDQKAFDLRYIILVRTDDLERVRKTAKAV